MNRHAQFSQPVFPFDQVPVSEKVQLHRDERLQDAFGDKTTIAGETVTIRWAETLSTSDQRLVYLADVIDENGTVRGDRVVVKNRPQDNGPQLNRFLREIDVYTTANDYGPEPGLSLAQAAADSCKGIAGFFGLPEFLGAWRRVDLDADFEPCSIAISRVPGIPIHRLVEGPDGGPVRREWLDALLTPMGEVVDAIWQAGIVIGDISYGNFLAVIDDESGNPLGVSLCDLESLDYMGFAQIPDRQEQFQRLDSELWRHRVAKEHQWRLNVQRNIGSDASGVTGVKVTMFNRSGEVPTPETDMAYVGHLFRYMILGSNDRGPASVPRWVPLPLRWLFSLLDTTLELDRHMAPAETAELASASAYAHWLLAATPLNGRWVGNEFEFDPFEYQRTIENFFGDSSETFRSEAISYGWNSTDPKTAMLGIRQSLEYPQAGTTEQDRVRDAANRFVRVCTNKKLSDTEIVAHAIEAGLCQKNDSGWIKQFNEFWTLQHDKRYFDLVASAWPDEAGLLARKFDQKFKMNKAADLPFLSTEWGQQLVGWGRKTPGCGLGKATRPLTIAVEITDNSDQSFTVQTDNHGKAVQWDRGFAFDSTHRIQITAGRLWDVLAEIAVPTRTSPLNNTRHSDYPLALLKQLSPPPTSINKFTAPSSVPKVPSPKVHRLGSRGWRDGLIAVAARSKSDTTADVVEGVYAVEFTDDPGASFTFEVDGDGRAAKMEHGARPNAPTTFIAREAFRAIAQGRAPAGNDRTMAAWAVVFRDVTHLTGPAEAAVFLSENWFTELRCRTHTGLGEASVRLNVLAQGDDGTAVPFEVDVDRGRIRSAGVTHRHDGTPVHADVLWDHLVLGLDYPVGSDVDDLLTALRTICPVDTVSWTKPGPVVGDIPSAVAKEAAAAAEASVRDAEAVLRGVFDEEPGMDDDPEQEHAWEVRRQMLRELEEIRSELVAYQDEAAGSLDEIRRSLRNH